VTSNPMKYVLFTLQISARACRRLRLKRSGFQTRVIRKMRNEHTSESFRTINPKGRVPALLCNGQASLCGLARDFQDGRYRLTSPLRKIGSLRLGVRSS
jgi:hypothetical protein